MMVELVMPHLKYKTSFIKLIQDFREHNETAQVDYYKVAEEDFEAYIKKLDNQSKGIDVPKGSVKTQTFWLKDEQDEIIGNIRIRDELKGAFLINAGGHIGYDIAPRFRRLGYGKTILMLGLLKAQERGLNEVIISCEDTNEGSKKIIQSCGCEYYDSYTFENPKTVYLKYKKHFESS